ncbi:MAG: AAA family ATPase [Candidatus Omnitrophica bacterium]|nr:AAA family ATPase [Candidatus Omnitrophota bacterium]
MRIIAVANQKGGCGKTTTSINLARCLSFLGKEVLLIDFDPQGHATLGLGIHNQDFQKSIFDVIDFPEENNPALLDVVIKRNDNLDIVPSDVVLSAIEQKLSGVPGRETRLLEKLAGITKSYDFIIIDCPPSLGLLTFNALMAAEEVIVPLEPSSFSLHGLQKIFETVHLLEEGLGHRLSICALVTMFEGRTRFSREFETRVSQVFDGRVFQSKIRRTVRLREAAQIGQSIVEFDRNSTGFQDYMNLACELVEQKAVKKDAVTVFDTTVLDTVAGPSGHSGNGGILFSVDIPGARSVQLAGDFNNWAASDLALADQEKGRWALKLPLNGGRYKYKYIVDGEWRTDPANNNVESNQYGTLDSVLEVS